MSATQGRGGKRNFPKRSRHPSSKVRINFGALPFPYADDDADLQLKSEDGVVFRVKASALKTASTVFADMLGSSAAHLPSAATDSTSMAIGPSPNSQPPIEISSPSLIVRLFVDLMYHQPLLNTFSDTPSSSSTPTPAEAQAAVEAEALSPLGPSTHFTDIFRTANDHLTGRQNGVACLSALLELLDRFDCASGMRERALKHFKPTFELNPWAVFVIAAKYDDVHLGKKAIKRFWGYKGAARWWVQPATMRSEDAEAVPAAWLMGYLRAHAEISRIQGHLGADVKDTDEKFYKDVALVFTTKTPAPPTSARVQADTNQRPLIHLG